MRWSKKAIWPPCQSEACKNTDRIGSRSHLFAVVLSLFFLFCCEILFSLFQQSAFCFLGVVFYSLQLNTCAAVAVLCIVSPFPLPKVAAFRCVVYPVLHFPQQSLGEGFQPPLLLPRLLNKSQSFWLWCVFSRSVFTTMVLIYPCSSLQDIHFFSTASCSN